MPDIKIDVTNKTASQIGTAVIVCGNADYTVTFTFDNEWGAYQEKTARFRFIQDGAKKFIDVLFSGSTCKVPILSNIETVSVGVYAGDLHTTTGAEVKCQRSILCEEGTEHEPPDPDVYNQILEYCAQKLGSNGGTVTGDYYKDGKAFIHEGNLDLLDDTDNVAIVKKATGSAITIDSANAPLQQLKLYGKTTQNGTPTPDAPVPLVSVGDSGSFEVGVYGENLIKYPYNDGTSKTINGITFTANADGSITVNGTSTANAIFFLNGVTNMKLQNPLYVHSINKGTGATLVVHYYLNGDQWTASTIPIGAKIVEVYLEVANGKTINNAIVKPMITTNATETEFETPSSKQTLTITDTLCNINGYADEKNFARGITTKNTAKFVVNGSENWTYNTSGKEFVVYPQEYGIQPIRDVGLSSHFPKAKQKDLSFFVSGGTGGLAIYDYNGKWGDLATFKTWLNENNVTFVLQHETPIETPLTETELNAYRQLYTNKGNTTILSEADMEVDYYINKPNAQAIGNIHSQVNKDYFKLQQAIISTGGSTL